MKLNITHTQCFVYFWWRLGKLNKTFDVAQNAYFVSTINWPLDMALNFRLVSHSSCPTLSLFSSLLSVSIPLPICLSYWAHCFKNVFHAQNAILAYRKPMYPKPLAIFNTVNRNFLLSIGSGGRFSDGVNEYLSMLIRPYICGWQCMKKFLSFYSQLKITVKLYAEWI